MNNKTNQTNLVIKKITFFLVLVICFALFLGFNLKRYIDKNKDLINTTNTLKEDNKNLNSKIKELNKINSTLESDYDNLKNSKLYCDLVVGERNYSVCSDIYDAYIDELSSKENNLDISYLIYDEEKFANAQVGNCQLQAADNRTKYSLNTNIPFEDYFSHYDFRKPEIEYTCGTPVQYNFVYSNGEKVDFSNVENGQWVVYKSINYENLNRESTLVTANVVVDYIRNIIDLKSNSSFNDKFGNYLIVEYISSHGVFNFNGDYFKVVSFSEDKIVARRKTDDAEVIISLSKELGVEIADFEFENKSYSLARLDPSKQGLYVHGASADTIKFDTNGVTIYFSGTSYNFNYYDEGKIYSVYQHDRSIVNVIEFKTDDSGNEYILFCDNSYYLSNSEN